MSTPTTPATPTTSANSGGTSSSQRQRQQKKDEFPHLSSPKQAINVRAIMEHAKSDLERLLSRVPGDKVLVLDEQIIGPLGHIADSTFLRVKYPSYIYVATK